MIDFINVSKKYANGTEALKNVNIHVDDGEFVFVVGSSGAGKSTFLKILQREEVASSGRVVINGQCLNDMKKRQIPYFRRELGIVFQDFRLIPTMTVYENVAFAMRVTGARESQIRKRVPFVITRVGLSSKAKCLPNELSGGEQQRVALARALVNDASIIIADEPTGNIDPNMAFEIVDLLKDINEKGTTVIMVTHEHDLVRQFDKRVITLDSGNVVSDGDISESPLVDTYEAKYSEDNAAIRRRRRKKSQNYYPDEKGVEDLNKFIETIEHEEKHGVHHNEVNVEEIFAETINENIDNPDMPIEEDFAHLLTDESADMAIDEILGNVEKEVTETINDIKEKSDMTKEEFIPDISVEDENGGEE